MFVDVLMTGRENINEVNKLKWDAISLFQQRGFQLYEKRSKETILETHDPCNTTEQNFARPQLETKAGKIKLLGILLDKQSNSFIIEISVNVSLKEIYCKH